MADNGQGDSATNIDGVDRPDFVPDPKYAHHSYNKGTYEWGGEHMCSMCGNPPGAVLHDSAPPADDASLDSAADTPSADAVSDKNALQHLQTALVEMIKALNNEPDSFNIANALMYVQDAVDCMKCEVKYGADMDDDPLETPAISTAALESLAAAKQGKAKSYLKKMRGAGNMSVGL